MATRSETSEDKSRKVKVAESHELIDLNRESRGLNQGMSEWLMRRLDPFGFHVCVMVMPHNDHWRTVWMVKVVGQDEPISPVLIDLPSIDRLRLLPSAAQVMVSQKDREPFGI